MTKIPGEKISRGAFIVFEGCDKSGKSTQCQKLVDKLTEMGKAVQLMRFPDRSTITGQIINNYLTQKDDMPDQAIHLLFSANRWECVPKMNRLLQSGVTLVVDRYAYSGVAYSAAKSTMDFEWCKQPESGLPKPDVVFLLQLNAESARLRQGYGEERYEKSEFQTAVFENLKKMKDDTWQTIHADRSVEEIHKEILQHTLRVTETVSDTNLKMW